MVFVNVDDIEEVNNLYRGAYLGPVETWEVFADKFYDKLLTMNLTKEEREELILNIKKINK